MRDKNARPGTIPCQPEDYSVETPPIPISRERVDGPHCADINQRNDIHDWNDIRGKAPRHGGIARFTRDKV